MTKTGRPMVTRGIFVTPDRRMFTTKKFVPSTSKSTSLGLDTVGRCHYCGNPAKDIDEKGFYVCENCMRLKVVS